MSTQEGHTAHWCPGVTLAPLGHVVGAEVSLSSYPPQQRVAAESLYLRAIVDALSVSRGRAEV